MRQLYVIAAASALAAGAPTCTTTCRAVLGNALNIGDAWCSSNYEVNHQAESCIAPYCELVNSCASTSAQPTTTTAAPSTTTTTKTTTTTTTTKAPTTTTSQTTTSPKPTTTTTTTTTSVAPGQCLAEYAQCSGQGFTTPLSCCPGTVCVVQSQWWGSCQKGTQSSTAVTTTNTVPPTTTTASRTTTTTTVTTQSTTSRPTTTNIFTTTTTTTTRVPTTTPVTTTPVPTTTTTPTSTYTHEKCRPDGLYRTPGLDVPYCTRYDETGREKMGADHSRRIIGYFTSWRTGANGQPAYLVNQLPWGKITHVNYAFAHIGSDYTVSIGNTADPNNTAVGAMWPGVDVDPFLGFRGHLGALATYKKRFGVSTLVSIGGWAETGGHFDDNGNRVADGGYYKLTTNSDGSPNLAAINRFARSCAEFLRKYQMDGIDIDYEYPTSMKDAGNPDDFSVSNPARAYLFKNYMVLMRTLREQLDATGVADGKHYLLSIASPSSGYLLRGMEAMQVVQYLDYVNLMTYDLHGAWNEYVGHNAPLYDTGKDAELIAWGAYGGQYKGIGYLNSDWSYHYFRGAMPAGRINIGVPYYTRGWQGVTGGTNGLWGTAALTDLSKCPAGTTKCGNGAMGIDNIWHDVDANGNEMGAGSNPMWHAKNLQAGVYGSYLTSYGFNASGTLTGTYARNYDHVAVAPWLWNDQKKTFISTEDAESIKAKVDYVISKGVGGLMIWEMAGDYSCYKKDTAGRRTNVVDSSESACATGQGEYFIGDTLTSIMYDGFKAAAPYGNTISNIAIPAKAAAIEFSVGEFALGDNNYPISPKATITNRMTVSIPANSQVAFSYGTSAPDNMVDWSGAGLKVVESGNPVSNNVGGLKGDFNRVTFKIPSELAPGASTVVQLVYYLPMTGPSDWRFNINGTWYAAAQEQPNLPRL